MSASEEAAQMDETHVRTLEAREQPQSPPEPWPDVLAHLPSAPRKEGVDKVTGRARYASDVHLPGMLWVKMLRCPHAHARIRRIDERKALALPGVHAILSLNNAPAIDWYDRGVLFERTPRFAGEEVAAVAAESECIAEDALRLIEVDYEPLPFVLDISGARAPGAPHVHTEGNLADEPSVQSRGNVRRGLREAELIIDRVYTTQVALHNSLEAHACTALWEGEQLTLYASTQGVFALRKEIAGKLQMAEDRVRVFAEHIGGAFGSKQVAWKQDVIAALLARQTHRPVRFVLDRADENLAAGNRNATRQHVRIGAKRDGTLTAICAEVDVQIGAYRAGGEGSIVDWIYHSLYACRNVRTEQRIVYTHTGPAIAFRAPGYVEGAFALESAMDELSRALQIDPIELRLRNYTETDQMRRKPYTSPDSLRLCYQRVRKAFGWDGYSRAPATGPMRRGIGFAAHDWVGGGGYPPGRVRVTLRPDGAVKLDTGTQDIGTGTRTALAQICAQTLGVALDAVQVALGDTRSELQSPVSSGSATLATLGPPVQAACEQVRRRVLEIASGLLRVEPDRLRIENGRIRCDEPGVETLDMARICAAVGTRVIQATGKRNANRRSHSVRTFGAQCVEVEVDTATGYVRVLRVVAAHDCGRIINRNLVDSQVMGGVTQALGFALTEQRIVDPRSGVVLNANLEDYKVPTVVDTPQIVHAALDVPDYLANPTGAKGVGEPPIIPTAPAIANAIFDAVGVRLHDTPFTACRMLEALQSPPRSRLCDREPER
jgi:xanthine dehydrogenase YagR molybdenum-binding subunit